MARDLIPPPSPAGRPAPDPERAAAARAGRRRGRAGGADAGRHARPVGVPRRASGSSTGVLAGCAVAAAVAARGAARRRRARRPGGAADRRGPGRELVAVASRARPRSISGAQEIAKKIERQLQGRPLEEALDRRGRPDRAQQDAAGVRRDPVRRRPLHDRAGRRRAVQARAASARTGGCEGSQPSAERRRLLRREALELSLYSFRYLPDVTMVVTLLPPAPKAEQVHPKQGRARRPRRRRPRRTTSARRCSSGPATCASSSSARSPTTMATKAPKIDALAGPGGQADRQADALEPLHLRAHPAAGRQHLPGARPALVAGARADGHARVLRVALVVLRAQAHRELRAAPGPDELLVAAGVAEAGLAGGGTVPGVTAGGGPGARAPGGAR